MIDPLTDLLLVYAGIGGVLGYALKWATTIEGKWYIQSRILKKNAKVLVTWIPGRLFKQQLVIPKTEAHHDKPSGLGKLLGRKESAHTLLLGWFRQDAPIYRKIGSATQYIFNRQGDTNAFDLEKIEYGVYQHTQESSDLLKQAQAILAKNEGLAKDYQKAWDEKNVELSESIKQQVEANVDQANLLIQESNALRSWSRITNLPSTATTAFLDNEIMLQKAREMKGFLGKLEALLNNVKWLLFAAAGFAFVAALASGYLAMKGVHF
jgi:hypothetical protein